MNITCDNDAKMNGWIEYMAESDCYDLHISVAPNTDMDGYFKAFCHDDQEMIRITGWLFSFYPVTE